MGYLDRASSWYVRGAEQGDVKAMFHLAWVYEEMASDPSWSGDKHQKTRAAAEWYQASAKVGFSPSMNNLGVMASSGLDGPPNHAKAFGWYEAAWPHMNPVAIINLYAAHSMGRGVAKNPEGVQQVMMWHPKGVSADALESPTLARTRLADAYDMSADIHGKLRAAIKEEKPVLLRTSDLVKMRRAQAQR